MATVNPAADPKSRFRRRVLLLGLVLLAALVQKLSRRAA